MDMYDGKKKQKKKKKFSHVSERGFFEFRGGKQVNLFFFSDASDFDLRIPEGGGNLKINPPLTSPLSFQSLQSQPGGCLHSDEKSAMKLGALEEINGKWKGVDARIVNS